MGKVEKSVMGLVMAVLALLYIAASFHSPWWTWKVMWFACAFVFAGFGFWVVRR